jgi:hypothetical protein
MQPIKAKHVAWLLAVALILGPVTVTLIDNLTTNKQEIRKL